MSGDLEMVRWRDANFDLDPDVGPDEEDDYVVETVGFVTGETELWLVTHAESLPDGTYRGRTRIPHGMVIERHKLAEVLDPPTIPDYITQEY